MKKYILSLVIAGILTGIGHAQKKDLVNPPNQIKVDNAVVAIDWSRFAARYPNDANAELEKMIALNAVKYALNTWCEERFGSQPAGEH